MTTSRIPLFILLFVLLTSQSASAQRAWTRGNTFGHVAGLSSVYMRDSLDGWAVGSQGRILRTTDAGESWIDESLDSNFQFNDVTFVDERNGVIVGGLMRPDQYWEPIIFRTRDGGRSWQRSVVDDASPGVLFEEVVVSGNRMAAVGGGLWVSQDSGATWTGESLQQLGPFGPVIWDLFVSPDGGLYVFARDGLIYRSSEDVTVWYYAGGIPTGGEGWTHSTAGIPTPDIMMMLDWSGNIQRSTDTGRTWTTVAQTEPEDLPPYFYWAGARFHFPDARNGLLVTPNGILYTTDDTGATWTRSPSMIPRRIIRSHFPTRDIGYAVTASHIHKTTDGGKSWEVKSGAYGADFRSVSSSHPDGWFAVGARGAIAGSFNGGQDWLWIYSDTRRTLNDISVLDAWNGYIVGDSGTVLRSGDGSGIWVTLPSPLPHWNLRAVEAIDLASAIAVGYDNLTKSGIIVRTVDSGKSWQNLEPSNTWPLRDLFLFDAMTGFAVGDNGTILATVDGGATWTPRIVEVHGSASWSLSSVHFIDRDNGMVAGTGPAGGVVIRTTNGGLSWRLVVSPVPGTEHKVVRMSSPTHATLLSSTGIITTIDGGVTWQQEKLFDEEILLDMEFDSAGGGVVVGTDGGVYRSRSIVSGVEEERRMIPWEKLRGPMLH